MKATWIGVSILSVAFAGGLAAKSWAGCPSCGTSEMADQGAKAADLDTAGLKKAIEAGATVYDVRGEKDYAEGHVPGAKNLPLPKVDASTLGDKKDAALVFYCASTKCPACHHAAEKAIKLGYTNVSTYSKGIAGWEADGEKAAK